MEKKLNIYYANWSVYNDVHQKQHVRDLPWDRISTINHAFWRIVPNADRTEFPIASIDAQADFGKGMCFDQYEEMTALYPDVAVVISVGGWNDTKWFAEMASTESGRKSFIDSCVETLVKYPFLGGIDIDWEYPGASRNHEGEGFTGSSGDKDNFTALMREMRGAFDAAGLNDKIITYCAPSSVESLKSGRICIDFLAIDPYVDRVNVMTYDMAGSWTNKAMHHTALHPSRAVERGASASEVAEYIISLGVPSGKINIGSPLYSHGWIVNTDDGETAPGRAAAGPAFGKIGNGSLNWFDLKTFENTPGWEVLYDETAEAAYMFNINMDSKYYRHFYTYESERSLQAKLDYINATGLGGLIVWTSSGDSIAAGYPMLTQMAKGLGLYDGEIPVYEAPPDDDAPVAIRPEQPAGNVPEIPGNSLTEDGSASSEDDPLTGSDDPGAKGGRRLLWIASGIITAAAAVAGVAAFIVKKRN